MCIGVEMNLIFGYSRHSCFVTEGSGNTTPFLEINFHLHTDMCSWHLNTGFNLPGYQKALSYIIILVHVSSIQIYLDLKKYKNKKSVACSSQGSHMGQLDSCNRLAVRSVKSSNVYFVNHINYFSIKQLPSCLRLQSGLNPRTSDREANTLPRNHRGRLTESSLLPGNFCFRHVADGFLHVSDTVV